MVNRGKTRSKSKKKTAATQSSLSVPRKLIPLADRKRRQLRKLMWYFSSDTGSSRNTRTALRISAQAAIDALERDPANWVGDN